MQLQTQSVDQVDDEGKGGGMMMIHEMRGQEEGADALKRRERKGDIDAKRKEKKKMKEQG